MHTTESGQQRRANASSSKRPQGNYLTYIAFLLCAAHFIFLLIHFEPAISTPDANGYFAQARLIAREGRTYLQPESPLQYIGPHWLPGPQGRYFTSFPPGLPLILAIPYRLLGPEAALLVNPAMASLSLLGLFLFCRSLLGTGWGLLAMALLAFNPFANEHALYSDSHTAVVFFLVWALVFLFRSTRSHAIWPAFLTGILVGTIPTVRYPEGLFVFVSTAFLAMQLRKGKITWRSFGAYALGVALPLSCLLIRNQLAFGAFWRTGYGLSDEPAHFGLRYLLRYFLPYVQQLFNNGCGLTFVVGTIGTGAMCFRRDTREMGLLFLLLVVPITLLYMAYCWAPDPQSMRFLLPTFPIYMIASAWLLHFAARFRSTPSLVGAIAILLVTGLWGLPRSTRSMQMLKARNAVLADVTKLVERDVEPGSVLIADEGISQHLDFIGCCRLVDTSVLRSLLPGPGRPAGLPGESLKTMRKLRNVQARSRYAGLTGEELFAAFCRDVWAWAGKDKRVYLLGKERQIEEFRSRLPRDENLVAIGKLELPATGRGGFVPAPPLAPEGEPLLLPGPMGPDRIFDLRLDGQPLFLVRWARKSTQARIGI